MHSTPSIRRGSFRVAPLGLTIGASCVFSGAASAQLAISWSTIDGGGGSSSGGGLTVIGTIGQADAGAFAPGALSGACGFWTAGGNTCYANCDASTIAPVLNVNDFSCFLNRYAANDPAANCDASTIIPVLNVNDFSCFLNRYAVGCP